jgi:uroporphyrinogen III methyltransferase/synthase
VSPRRGKVWLVGAGPGDPGLLTLKAARAIERCEVLVYDYLASQAIVDLAPPGCERIYVGKKAGEHSMTQPEITELVIALALDGKRVVRLKGGDVFVFARGGEEAQALSAAGIAFEIVPGLTSAIAVPAYAGIPVTHRDHNTTFSISTGHEDPLKGYTSLDYARLANPKATTIFLMAMTNLTGIIGALLANGLSPELPVAIVREGTKPTQETLVATLGTIVAEVERVRFAAPAVVVIGTIVNERETIRWFDRTPLFGKSVLVTRPAGQNAEFAQQLWEAGAEPLLAPTIAIGAPDDIAAAAAAVARVNTYAWVVFTSRNGVDAFFELLAASGHDARAFGPAKIAAIGPKTAAALRAHGLRADFVPPSYVNEALAEGLVNETAAGDRVLLFRAQAARDVVPEVLRAAGREVDDVAAYTTRFVDDATLRERAQRADIVTFTSASTVHGFVHNVSDAPDVLAHATIAAIGPVTAAAARELGIRVDVIAEDFTVDGLMHALETVVTA